MALQDSAVDDDDDGEKAAERGRTGWGRTARAGLRSGWWFGKRVAIAVVAITSAPVVIPPLLIFSTLGLAFAFPFSVYFASFACADKVMRSLLPLPSPSQSEGDGEAAAETQDEGGAEEEMKDEEFEVIKTAVEDAGNGELVEEEEPTGATGTRDPWSIEIEHLGSEDNREEGSTHPSVATEREIMIGPSSESVEDDGYRGGVEMVGEEKPMKTMATGDEREAVEKEKKEDNVGVVPAEHLNSEGNRDEGNIEKVEEGKPMERMATRDKESEEKGKKEEQAGAATAQEPPPSAHPFMGMAPAEREIEIEPSSLRSEYPSVPDGKRNEGAVKVPEEVKPAEGTGEMEEEREEEDGERKGEEVVDAVASKAKKPPPEEHKIEIESSAVEQSRDGGDTEMVEEERSTEEQKQMKGTGAAAPEMELPKSAHPSVAVEPDEHETEVKPSSLSSEYASAVEEHTSDVADTESRGSVEQGLDMRSGPEVEAAMPSDEEGLDNEEKIWEQIYAIRTIVGYKAVLRSSLIAELRVLYLFTGVEPPVSFKDDSDLVEVNDKLQFLKSVIGVK